MEEIYVTIEVEKISFDTENPRIKMALEKYGEQLNEDRIQFALSSATDIANGTSSFSVLKDSIRASGGIISPINVIARDSGFICIDGNTRLAIYKQFIKEKVPGNWSKIKAIVFNNASQRDIETIRVSAHLIGFREWPSYEKASYLHYLRNTKCMDYNEMIAYLGGNKAGIERLIYAYQDMNEYCRDKVRDIAFHMDRFNGFVELQKPKIKEAIFDAGLDLDNFGDWIRDGKIYNLADVRRLPKVLSNERAKEIFLNGGPRSIEKAINYLDQQSEQESQTPQGEVKLTNASLNQLANTMAQRIIDISDSDRLLLQAKEHEDAVEQLSNLEKLSDKLKKFLHDVSE